MTGQSKDNLKNQVSYAVLGSGRMARHIHRYFDLEGLSYRKWARSNDKAFNSVRHEANPKKRMDQSIESCTHILLLVSDQAIEEVIREYGLRESGKTLIHCSGALSIDGVYSAHPLMSFSEKLYDHKTYQSIPFVIEKGGVEFKDLFPALKNPNYAMDKALKPLYHAYCVSSGNFTTLLWTYIMAQFPEKLGLPKEVLLPYLRQISQNLESNLQSALTGPLVRGDSKTLQKNIDSLDGDPLQDIYKAFVQFYKAKSDK